MKTSTSRATIAVLATSFVVLSSFSAATAQTARLSPSAMSRVGAVDDRNQSYNVEMLEVTGGRFWRPYGPELEPPFDSLRRPRRHRAVTRPPEEPRSARVSAANRPYQRATA